MFFFWLPLKCTNLNKNRLLLLLMQDQYQFCYRAALEYLSSFDHYTDN